MLKALLARQRRYNGHLEDHLLSARTRLKKYVPQTAQPPEPEQIKCDRNELLQALFAVLLN